MYFLILCQKIETKSIRKLISIPLKQTSKMASIKVQTQQQNSSIAMPPAWFRQSVVPADKALYDINMITDNLKNVDSYYAYRLSTNLQWRAKSNQNYEVVGYIPAPPSIIDPKREILKQIIGKDGCYFKQTTENCDIDFIYYDNLSENFVFWGSSQFNTTNAMKIIRSRICRTIAKHFGKVAAPTATKYVSKKENVDPFPYEVRLKFTNMNLDDNASFADSREDDANWKMEHERIYP